MNGCANRLTPREEAWLNARLTSSEEVWLNGYLAPSKICLCGSTHEPGERRHTLTPYERQLYEITLTEREKLLYNIESGAKAKRANAKFGPIKVYWLSHAHQTALMRAVKPWDRERIRDVLTRNPACAFVNIVPAPFETEVSEFTILHAAVLLDDVKMAKWLVRKFNGGGAFRGKQQESVIVNCSNPMRYGCTEVRSPEMLAMLLKSGITPFPYTAHIARYGMDDPIFRAAVAGDDQAIDIYMEWIRTFKVPYDLGRMFARLYAARFTTWYSFTIGDPLARDRHPYESGPSPVWHAMINKLLKAGVNSFTSLSEWRFTYLTWTAPADWVVQPEVEYRRINWAVRAILMVSVLGGRKGLPVDVVRRMMELL